MLALIPMLALAGFFLILGNISPSNGWRRAFLHAAILWDSYMILSTELLSIFRGVTPLGLAAAWTLPVLMMAGWLIWRIRHNQQIHFPMWDPPKGWMDRVLLLSVLVIIGITGLVAWFSPPQTWDSLNYHLSRVAHWAQERAVRHFATGIEIQNCNSPGAEMAILNFYVLMGGDRLATFVEWFAMVGSLVGVSLVAMQLGADPVGQLVAVVFAATIPMGIVQASSTMTDYVVAFWMICVASECMELWKEGIKPVTLVFVGLAASLAIVTKPTAYAYLIPFAVWVVVLLIRRKSIRQILMWGLIMIALLVTINGGHFVRNYVTYGNPIGWEKEINKHASRIYEPKVFLSNLLRNLSLHVGTPWSAVNKIFYVGVVKVHNILGLSVSDPATTSAGHFYIRVPTTHENLIGNPLHALLCLLLFYLVLVKPQSRNTFVLAYTLVAAGTFFIFSLVFKWQIFGSRYHLPFFILFAPIAGYGLGKFFTPIGGRLIAVGLIISARTMLFSIVPRPLIPNENSYGESVLVESRQNLLFVNGMHLIKPYIDMVGMIQDQGCKTVGFMLSGGGAEYPLWVLLGAPDPDLYVEWIVTGAPSDRYKSPDFQPCAVICGACPEEWESTRGLPREYWFSRFRLFIGKGETTLD